MRAAFGNLFYKLKTSMIFASSNQNLFLQIMCPTIISHSGHLPQYSTVFNLPTSTRFWKKDNLRTLTFFDSSPDSDEDDKRTFPTFPKNAEHPGYLDLCIHCTNCHAFTIIQQTFKWTTNEVEEYLYDARLRINKQRVSRVSAKIFPGDIIDLVINFTDKDLTVKRIEILHIDHNKNQKGNMPMWVRRWKKLKLKRIL